MIDIWTLLFRCLWLFIIGGILGVIIETFWWRLRYGFWQAHYTLLWLPLCTIYSFGAVGCYLAARILSGYNIIFRYIVYSLLGTVIELIGGLLLDRGLKMRAWDYRNTFLNVQGYVNGLMSVLWGFLGLGFERLVPGINLLFHFAESDLHQVISLVIAIVLGIDMFFTSVSLIRWSHRHQQIPPRTAFGRFIDRHWNDGIMAHRFVNWHFIDEPDISRCRETALNLNQLV